MYDGKDDEPIFNGVHGVVASLSSYLTVTIDFGFCIARGCLEES